MNKNNLENYGYTSFYESQVEQLGMSEGDLMPARVTEVHKEQYKIVTKQGESYAKLKGAFFHNSKFSNVYPIVGDFVLAKYNPWGEDMIYQVLERKSKFSRLDSVNKMEQDVAANFDYVFIMASLNHDFNIKRMERYLTAAWQSGGMPVIVLTKLDLCNDHALYKTQIEAVAAGVPIIFISSLTGQGLDQLREYVKPSKTIVFLGSSGVGKSSLVNAIAGEEIMKVNSIREGDSKGRHTTTHRQLVMLQNGTMIIDTPGMRELGMWNVSDGLDVAFADVEALAGKCKFRNCNHQSEPGCAVKEALESGELSKERWQNYVKLKKEAKFSECKESAETRLKEKARYKNMAKFQKQFKKSGREMQSMEKG